jgi:septal ring factor EnvC (AmiA/AmiB activator)
MTSPKALLDKNPADAPIVTIREILFGPQWREMEALLARHAWGLEQLAEQYRQEHAQNERALRQLRADLAAQNKRQAHRFAQYRAAVRKQLRKLSDDIDGLAQRIEAESGGRSTVAETMAALANQLRAIPTALETSPPENAPARPRKRSKTRDASPGDSPE